MTNDAAIQAQDQRLAESTYWLNVYTACRLHKLKDAPSFAEFQQDPWTHLEAAGQGGAPSSMDKGYEPLLPDQAAIARQHEDLGAYLARRSRMQTEGQHKEQRKAPTGPIAPFAFTRPSRA